MFLLLIREDRETSFIRIENRAAGRHRRASSLADRCSLFQMRRAVILRFRSVKESGNCVKTSESVGYSSSVESQDRLRARCKNLGVSEPNEISIPSGAGSIQRSNRHPVR